MVVTHEWLEKYATASMGWTRKQLKVLGVNWPPRKGWKKALVGTEISDETAKEFVSAYHENLLKKQKKRGDEITAQFESMFSKGKAGGTQ